MARLLRVCPVMKLALTILCLLSSAAPQDFEKLSPFSGLRWNGSVPEVEVGGTWYELVKLEGKSASEIVDYCKETYGRRWEKRFAEDLVEVLAGMRVKHGRKVTLEVKELDSGTVRVLKNVEMTERNRRLIRKSRQRPSRRPRVLSRDDALKDLDVLRDVMEKRFSYYTRKGIDHDAAFEEVRKAVGKSIPSDAFSLRVSKLLARFGDGHSRLSGGLDAHVARGYLPFLAAEAEGKLVAFQEDRSGFLDAGHPYLRSLDGLSPDRWMKAARAIVPAGSEQFVRLHSIRSMRYLNYLRSELGRPVRSTDVVILESKDGTSTKTLKLRTSDRRTIYGPWPRGESRTLETKFGYLRIPVMESDPRFLKSLTDQMERFRETEGLIIDVRGNGGGSRHALRTLFPYFMKKQDAPHVANVAAYRLAAGDDPKGEHLANRFLYSAGSSRWTGAERAAIRRFARSFRPEWKLPGGHYGDWNYMILSPPADTARFHYDRPIVILMDSACFSATDIFLGAFKGWRNVTLMGTPSGGGSGRSQGYILPKSGIRLRLSSMASFRPDGRLYEGRGVEPDVVAMPSATDWIGRTDSVLDAALRRLSK